VCERGVSDKREKEMWKGGIALQICMTCCMLASERKKMEGMLSIKRKKERKKERKKDRKNERQKESKIVN
jgi:hypothetical protein